MIFFSCAKSKHLKGRSGPRVGHFCGKIILAGGKIISARFYLNSFVGKIILAGGEIILTGGEIILTGEEVILTCGEIISLFTESQCRLVISQTIQLGFWRFGA